MTLNVAIYFVGINGKRQKKVPHLLKRRNGLITSCLIFFEERGGGRGDRLGGTFFACHKYAMIRILGNNKMW